MHMSNPKKHHKIEFNLDVKLKYMNHTAYHCCLFYYLGIALYLNYYIKITNQLTSTIYTTYNKTDFTF